MMITLTNDFHGTKVVLVPQNGRLTARQVKRARNVLCGVADCRCGNDLGARGLQSVLVRMDADYAGAIVTTGE